MRHVTGVSIRFVVFFSDKANNSLKRESLAILILFKKAYSTKLGENLISRLRLTNISLFSDIMQPSQATVTRTEVGNHVRRIYDNKLVKGGMKRRHLYITAITVEKFVAELKYRFESRERMIDVIEITFSKLSKPIITYKTNDPKRIYIIRNLKVSEARILGSSCPPSLHQVFLNDIPFSLSTKTFLNHNKTFTSISVENMSIFQVIFNDLQDFVEIFFSKSAFTTNPEMKIFKSYKFLKLTRLTLHQLKYSSISMKLKFIEAIKYLKNIKALGLHPVYKINRLSFEASVISGYNEKSVQKEKSNLFKMHGLDFYSKNSVNMWLYAEIGSKREIRYWLSEIRKNNCFEYFDHFHAYQSITQNVFKQNEYYSIKYVLPKASKQNFKKNILSLIQKN